MFLAILFSIVPVMILLGLLYYMGEVKKQPLLLLLILFVGGILSWILVRYVSQLLGNDIYKSQMEISTLLGNSGFFLVSFGIISIIEELSKYIVITIMCFKNKYFKNAYDAIMYAACISLGFAFIENIMYINNYGMSVALSRALFSIPAHACFGIIMGYFLGMSRICKDNNLDSDSAINRYSAFFIPFLFHGFYDFLLNFSDKIIYVIFLVYVILMYIFVIYLIYRLYNLDSKWLKSKKDKKIRVQTVKRDVQKNLYYDTLYNNEENSKYVPDNNNQNIVQNNNWKQNGNERINITDPVDIKMFKDEDGKYE